MSKYGFRHAIVVGASSGIGAEVARFLAEDECRVAVLARRLDRLDSLAASQPNLLPVRHDVTDYDEIPGLFQDITKELGGLDLVVYAAGIMPTVGPSEYDFVKDRQMIEVNLLGCMAWMNQAAARFEQTGRGSLVAIGSVAGDRGRRGQPGYNTSKAAVATFMEGLRNRLARHGVKVVTIKPGPTATEMTAHLDLKGAMDPRIVAEFVLRRSHRTGEHYVKPAHRVMFAVIRLIPSAIFRRLNL